MTTDATADWGAVGERLFQARKSCKLGQVDAADGIGISLNTLMKYEMGVWKPYKHQLEHAARLYNTTIDWLMIGEE